MENAMGRKKLMARNIENSNCMIHDKKIEGSSEKASLFQAFKVHSGRSATHD